MRSTALAVLLFAIVSSASCTAHTDSNEPRETMGQIFDAMRRVLALSLSDERFSDPAMRDSILEAFRQLAQSGSELETHAKRRDRGFSFLSASLARDTRDIRDRFAEGRVGEARFLLHELTQTCVACHSRLPSDDESSLAKRFVEDTDLSTLPLEERARLQVATRQFDRAADTYADRRASLRAISIPAGTWTTTSSSASGF